MSSPSASSPFDAFYRGDYAEAVIAFEDAIAAHPEDTKLYAYLGLAYLLQGAEAEAQLAWMTPEIEGLSDNWGRELAEMLQQEAQRLGDPTQAWLLGQYLRELVPDDLENLLRLLQWSLELQLWTEEEDLVAEVCDRLQATDFGNIPQETLWEAIDRLLEHTPTLTGSVDLCRVAATRLVSKTQFIDRLLDRAKALEFANQPRDALQVARLCVELDDTHFRAFVETGRFFQITWDNESSFPYLDRAIALADSLPQKILASHLKLRGLMRGAGYWQQAKTLYAEHRRDLETLVTDSEDISLDFASRIITAGSMTAYFTDDLPSYRQLRNQIGTACQHQLQKHLSDRISPYPTQHQQRPAAGRRDLLKIGYLSECFRQHSVGWLMRWLLHHHDRDRFEIHLYSLHHTGDALQQTFAAAEGPNFHELPYSALTVADKIHQDQIDILLDLDSITSNCGCSVLALKPAPIQVTWLGSDASGIPAVDYFISDPYVLPEDAQTHYSETLWQLPQTYIAVDGFEVGVPTLRRDRLGIPPDAVVYFSSQTGYKRNPEDIRRQLQILREVPNSIFLVKGAYTQIDSARVAFENLAEEEGVDRHRLRFLPTAISEAVHRANIAIADVVLDTYPYNGTTTTLETLWMGVPVVTRVGQQFASRQGYTLLKNAGVEAGIAFTDEDYIEWGVRLGTDTELRKTVVRQLRESRKTAPLWNARQFTREMERAYLEMMG
ncbi:O-linked N-acetylglucosamine transferase, SPINDLY family protein [Baaleninema sp.]|uniref:O-linked N-acetylglucosamine transferase, SPINDLY family protein n=1 Tax=Baaleninema sp. TaxID=3101197 RepID=UPI003CFBF9DD